MSDWGYIIFFTLDVTYKFCKNHEISDCLNGIIKQGAMSVWGWRIENELSFVEKHTHKYWNQ